MEIRSFILFYTSDIEYILYSIPILFTEYSILYHILWQWSSEAVSSVPSWPHS